MICRQAGRILLVAKEPARWSLPGGRREPGETLVEAARRELAEETTLDLRDLTFLFRLDGNNTTHHVFAVDVPSSKTVVPGREIALCEWIEPSDMTVLPVGKATRTIVGRFLGAPSEPAVLV